MGDEILEQDAARVLEFADWRLTQRLATRGESLSDSFSVNVT
jgi:hypothetical protein